MHADYYYSGVDGNTLRVECESIEELLSLQSVFQSLDSGHLDCVDLTEKFTVIASETYSIQVSRVTRRDFRECEVTKSGRRKFVWRADSLDLARYISLIDGLLNSGTSIDAYQILTADTAQCIAVEIPKPRIIRSAESAG
jgi:hypothetical protein